MRWSDTLIPTLRDAPQEAEIPSHKLMLRAGLMRRLAGGLYTFLPLGLRALRKLEAIVREEMDRAGALEVLMPAAQPRELWDRSGRYAVMGELMYHVTDRQKREMVLGPTHEEVITDLASREISSYRQLPKTFYQIQTKFRDEIRPRFGLMRAREFIMKDAYSFDTAWDAADRSYQAMYDAYARIFARCGLRTRVVEADTGAMGGKWSHEFMVPSEFGEDGIVECEACGYAANLERAERAAPAFDRPGGGGAPPPEEVATPGRSTIEDVSQFLGCAPERLIKTIIYVVDGKTVAVCCAGDREVNESKLRRALEASVVEMADEAAIRRVTGARVGFAGPWGLSIPVYADLGLDGAADYAAGANRDDAHLRHVVLDRDARIAARHDLCVARGGDPCPRCSGALRERRGIEVGHVFKLGTKYSDSFGATFLDEAGAARPLVMGCYGIGVTRTLQAVVEQCRDDKGIIWPLSVAPYRVALLVLNPGDGGAGEAAGRLAADLEARGIDVLLDDRDERAGVKFNDADLLGLPLRVVVSARGLAAGKIEIKPRAGKEVAQAPLEGAADRIAAMCGE
ncbi:MAG: proline--tRNA ligase [Lentisphaerae bacterium]|nr:proline--tRNA ligase [Lentisphaerota bacterium]